MLGSRLRSTGSPGRPPCFRDNPTARAAATAFGEFWTAVGAAVRRADEPVDRPADRRGIRRIDGRQVEIDLVVQVVLLHLDEQPNQPVPHVVLIGSPDRGAIHIAADHVPLGVVRRRPAIPSCGERVERVVVFLGGQAELLQVVLALGTIRGFSRGLNRRHDESD